MAALILAGSVLAAAGPAWAAAESGFVDLAGTWRFALDPGGKGEAEGWARRVLPDSIALPGTTDLGGKGAPPPPAHGHLTRRHAFVGAAWYQRDIETPPDWGDQAIELHLERCHWVSDLWIDGQKVGANDSLSTPHRYDCTGILRVPGKHTITLRVDNTLRYGISEFTSAVAEHSATNWNGIVGRIGLYVRPVVHVARVRAELQAKGIALRIALENGGDHEVAAQVSAQLAWPGQDVPLGGAAAPVVCTPGAGGVALHIPWPGDAPRWNAWSPGKPEVEVSLLVDGEAAHRVRAPVPLRQIDAAPDGRRFVLNGQPIYLRGTLEAALHPASGHPPMDEARWGEIMQAAKDHGLNHLRFHAWCPPRAAFAAADAAGMYLQAECPWWGNVKGDGEDGRQDFLQREARRILDEYGNHPSFVLFSMGNELSPPHGPFLSETVRGLRNHDGRRLYTTTSGHFIPTGYGLDFADDYFVSLSVPEDMLRGYLRFDAAPPNTTHDYTHLLEQIERPLLVHELGQWTMYPDLDEADKYTGPVWHSDYERARESLAARGMAQLNRAFTRAAGAFMVRLYQEEIETVLRTPGLAGYQLLGLSDQAGWGCAVIGVLDAFWESKGIVDPEVWRRFCAPTVPLAKMEKRVWTQGEEFRAAALVHHSGPRPMEKARFTWAMRGEDGQPIARGEFPGAAVPSGGNTPLGEIAFSLAETLAPQRMELEIALAGTDTMNQWECWVFPRGGAAPADAVRFTTDWPEAREALQAGEPVVLSMPAGAPGHRMPGRFTPLFWAFGFNPHHQISLYCRADHPALAQFPTREHANWQWWELTHNAPAFILDDAPRDFMPIIHSVDNFNRNQKLGVLFEARVGEGRLLATTLDVAAGLDGRPAAAQLRRSLLDYANSGAFQPAHALELSLLDFVFEPNPVDALRVAAPDAAGAVLDVTTAAGRRVRIGEQAAGAGGSDQALVPLEFSLEDAPDAHAVETRAEGHGFALEGMEGDRAGQWLWSDHRAVLRIETPPGAEGTLYAQFVDWNNLMRRTRLWWEGELLGDLYGFAQRDVWLALPYTSTDTADGALTLRMQTIEGGSTLLRRFLLKP